MENVNANIISQTTLASIFNQEYYKLLLQLGKPFNVTLTNFMPNLLIKNEQDDQN